MSLTLEQLSDLVDSLQKDLVETQKKVETLETEVKQYRQDILELEQQLSQSITTQKLVVTEDAQISGRNVLADGQLIDTHEQRLSSHDATLNAHDGRLNSHDSTLNAHEGRLNSHDGTLSSHGTDIISAQSTANSAVSLANTAQGTANSAVSLANTAQGTANSALNLARQVNQRTIAITYDDSKKTTRITVPNGDSMNFFSNGTIEIKGNSNNQRWVCP
ncbi:alanine-zipper protein [Nostoc sp. ChiQUE01b]|uniref:alanine-zipper protein n=1 Tax=Nostoc sp. ChiQUE01b TaxID=3075376 RepID=UPI002AD2610D|nr:alanine-zipper protein [Nostoc sp. ChiQUE01b]MDZ8262902.1 alanine-zipper protein [Nostoc sp. ChiQUE01b]